MAASLRILAKGKLSTMQPALRAMFSRPCQAILSRGLSLTSRRLAGGDTIPTDAEQATGVEKKEYDAMAAGIQDPFNMKPYSGPPGTKDKPLEVFSMFDERIIGCVCEPDATVIVWKKIYMNEETRCDCGHWFVLRRGNPIKIEINDPEDHH